MKIEWNEPAKAWCVQAGHEEVKSLPRALCRYDGIRRCFWVPELAWRMLEKVAGKEHGHLFTRYYLPTEPAPVALAQTTRPPLPHQITGASHLLTQGRAGLFDDMGLGKTATVLTAYATLKQQQPGLKLLVLCPKRVIGEWLNEIRLTLGREAQEGELIINYDKIWRENYALGIEAQARGAVLVLDECHSASGITSRRFVALEGLARIAKYLWALSGTPVRNKPESFFPVYKLITGATADMDQFLLRFCATNMGRINGYKNLGDLEAVTRQYCLRREVSEVLTLPPLTEQIIRVPLEGRQKELYKELATGLRSAVDGLGSVLMEHSQNDLRVKLNNLVMAAAHPGLVDRDEESIVTSKMLALDEILAESGEQKVLVWSRHPWVLEKLAVRCREHGHSAVTMHGQRSDKDNEAAKRAFLDDPSVKVACLSLGAFGEGLNLQVATIAVYHDLYWTFDKFHQSQRRLWRTGQTKPVHLYYLLGQNTVDEYVMEVLKSKEVYQKLITGRGLLDIDRAGLMRWLRKPV